MRERIVAIHLGIIKTGGHTAPILKLPFQQKRIHALNRMIIIARLDQRVRPWSGAEDVRLYIVIVLAVNFNARAVLIIPAGFFAGHVQFDNVRGFINGCGRGIDVHPLHITPIQSGFRSVPVLVFVTQCNRRPVWQRQPEVNPGPALVEKQVGTDHELGRRDGGIERAAILRVFAPMLESGINVANVRLCQIEFQFEVLVGGKVMSLGGKFFVGADGFVEGKRFDTPGKSVTRPFQFAKFSLVPVQTDAAERQLCVHSRPGRDIRNAPIRPLIDPGAQQADLFRRKFAFAGRRHFDFVVGHCDVADQRTAGAVAGNNINAFRAAF